MEAPSSRDAAWAVSHPLRAALLTKLAEDTWSPVGLSRELDEPIGSCSHHVSVLNELGLLELVDVAPRRGAVEHFYRARWSVTVEVKPLQ
ncbi:MAG: helix-turn-helix transcriptional regulator [Polyangiaceae bacterium]|nr:helix-turn-helix transcriptional regulator [Polyangiaceae bacterium]